MRKLLIKIKKLKLIFERFVNFDTKKKNSAIFVDNFEWLAKLKYISFIRDIGSKFSVNKMLSLESTKQKIEVENKIKFLEFNYSILQAFDFLELNKKVRLYFTIWRIRSMGEYYFRNRPYKKTKK